MTHDEQLIDMAAERKKYADLIVYDGLSVFFKNLWHWRTAWAVRHLSKQLQRDKAFRDSWHANIAMPIYDATRPQCLCHLTEENFHKWDCEQMRGRVRKAAKALVTKLREVHADPRYMSVWIQFANHNGQYEGPFYVDELAALEKALEEPKL